MVIKINKTMELKTTKKFVLKAHLEACDKLKKEIEKEFPEAFKIKLEVGKWYKAPSYGEAMYFVTKIENKRYWAYGFDSFGYWTNNRVFGHVENKMEIANSEDVKDRLIEEAKRRGITIGATISNTGINKDFNFDFSPINYFKWFEKSNILDTGNGHVFDNGKWATPLDPNKELKEQIESLEQELKKLKERIK